MENLKSMFQFQHMSECKWLSLTERGNAKSDVIVNDLVWLWQLWITPPVMDY